MRFNDPTGLTSSPSDAGNPGHVGYDNGGSSVIACPVKEGSESGGNSSISINIDKDGRVKSVTTTTNDSRTTVYYNKDGSISRESTYDYRTGYQTLTYYRKNGAISETTFNSRGDIVRYRKWTPITSAPETPADSFQFYVDKELNAPPVPGLDTETGSAPARDDELWNGNLRLFNNCLTYFLNRLVDSDGTPWPEGGITRDDLAEITGIFFNGGNMKEILTSKRFCDYFNIDIVWVPIDPNTKLPTISFADYLANHPRARQGAYFTWTRGIVLEFHFARQDNTGYWSWKEGAHYVNDRDNNKNLVADPRFLKVDGYVFNAFIYISPRTE